MLVKDVMNKEVLSVNTETLIEKVAEILNTSGYCGLPVVNEYSIVAGLITQRELFSADHKIYLPMYGSLLKRTEFVARSKDDGLPYEANKIARITAEEIMNKKVFFANPEMDLKAFAVKVANLSQNTFPVVDYSNKLLGIITIGDIFRNLIGVEKINNNTTRTKHFADEEVKFVIDDMTSRFAFVSKTRVKFWIFAASVLFLVGFIAGILYVVNPKLFIK